MSGSGGLTRNVESFLFGNAVVSYGGAPTGNTAAYFDGSTGTYINLGTSTPVNFNLNTSNIFCEAWIYLNTFDSPSNRIIFHEGTGGLNWSFQVNSGRPVIGSWGTVSGVLTPFTFNGSNATTLSTWAHVAWAYTTAGRPIVYLNGIPELGSPLANYIIGYDSVNNTLIGRNFSPFLNGYIRDLRVIKGGVVPTTTFTPQAAPWAYGSVPTYASGGTNVLGLAAQYMTQVQVNNSSYVKSATGGDTVQLINGYYVHTFTTVGASTFTPATSGLVDVLVVAGGGGGGGNAGQSHAGGGGGAGELIYIEKFSVSGATSVTIGTGGAGEIAQTSSSWIASTPGANSSFGVLTANGGGRGGHSFENGGPGGSGGGGGRGVPPNGKTGGASTATTGFGNIGGGSGSALGSTASAGGGGGAGGPGFYSYNDSIRTPGGAGLTYRISGAAVTYAAGGEGGMRNSNGNGASANANTGYGGGGGDGGSSSLTSGGNGGSGIVIIRYPVSASLTGTPLFSQLSTAATSSAAAAFSLRAINGMNVKAVKVQASNVTLPPKFTSATSLGSNSYSQSLVGWAFGGSGTYITTGSSVYNGTTTPWKAFDNDTTTWWETTAVLYDSTGAYTGPQTITIDGVVTSCEWLNIKFPTGIVLSSYSMYARSGWTNRMPRNFVVAGSNNGTTWTAVDTRTNQTAWSGQTPITFTVNSSTVYSYFALCVTAVSATGSAQNLNLGQWTLNGTNVSWNSDFYADRLGNLLTAPITGTTMAAWLGGFTGNVVTWYDQSGAGRNATGTLTTLTKTSNVNLQWALNPTNGGLTVSGGAFLNGTNFTIACTTRRLGAKNNDGVYGYGANSSWVAQASVATSYGNNTRFGLVMPTTGSTAVVFNDSSYSAAFSSNANVVPSTYVAASEPVVYTAVTLTNASQQMYINGTANGLPISTLTQVTANASTSFTIGTINYYGNFLGEIGELFIFNSALGATDISTIYSSR